VIIFVTGLAINIEISQRLPVDGWVGNRSIRRRILIIATIRRDLRVVHQHTRSIGVHGGRQLDRVRTTNRNV